MNRGVRKLWKSENNKKKRVLTISFLYSLILSACGKAGKEEELTFIGLDPLYTPPEAKFDTPKELDETYKVLEPEHTRPYWFSALIMDNWENQIQYIIENNESLMKYSFPLTKPDYVENDIVSWEASNLKMQSASREIFSELNKVLEVQFAETDFLYSTNVISVARSSQVETAGFSYLPNNFHYIGSDVFISNEFANPEFVTQFQTNYDYEILVHEIGHAIGLKHPFESGGNTGLVLDTKEDNSAFTAMSYTGSQDTFNGKFRSLDWLTLTSLYGVNDDYKNGNDIYKFSTSEAIFIIDGGGLDVIDASDAVEDIYIDLRQAAHSYIGSKTSYITDAKQLTISYDSEVENAYSGSGNDYIVGNNVNNLVISGAGNDKIFLGEGSDTVSPGPGADIIDLSEEFQSLDTIIFQLDESSDEVDTIYGFAQGVGGDKLEFIDYFDVNLTLLPVILSDNIPVGNIYNHILRLVGDELNNSETLEKAFLENKETSKLSFAESNDILILTAASTNTGDDQNLFRMNSNLGSYEVDHLASFKGNYLDIDNWSSDNFGDAASELIA